MNESNNNEKQKAQILDKTSLVHIPSTANIKQKLMTNKYVLIIMTFLIANIVYWNRELIASHYVTTASEGQGQVRAEASARILPVETMAIKPINSYRVSRVYTGRVTARRTTELGFERTGKLTKILVEEGDIVKKNQTLAYLDTGNLQNTVRQLKFQRKREIANLQEMETGPRSQTIAAARAAVQDLVEQLELARTKNIRRKKLYEEGAISSEQLDESSNGVSVLKARLEEEKNKLDELLSGTRIERIAAQRALIKELDTRIADVNLNIKKSVLKAPFNSRISIRRVDEGSVVSPGASILRLVEMENLEVRIGLPTATAYRLRKGSYQKLTIGNKTYRATVESILPEIDSSTRTVTVVLKLQTSSQAQIAVGQVSRLELTETIRDSGYWLPVTSLAKSVRGLWSCYVLEKTPGNKSVSDENQVFTVKQKDVEVLYVKGDKMLVRGTLIPNDLVIINGMHRFAPGQLVRQSQTIK